MEAMLKWAVCDLFSSKTATNGQLQRPSCQKCSFVLKFSNQDGLQGAGIIGPEIWGRGPCQRKPNPGKIQAGPHLSRCCGQAAQGTSGTSDPTSVLPSFFSQFHLDPPNDLPSPKCGRHFGRSTSSKTLAITCECETKNPTKRPQYQVAILCDLRSFEAHLARFFMAVPTKL